MNEKNILYQIKDLEKLILRGLIAGQNKDSVINFEKGATPTQMRIVGYMLKNKDKEIYQRDLEKALNLRRATISDVLQRMEKNSLIQREVDPNDTRSKRILLSDMAKKIFINNANRITSLEKVAIKDIKDEELKQFTNIIKKMISNLNEHVK